MDNGQKIIKPVEEWISQAEYDIDTGFQMLDGGRYIYAIFMSHLALEKMLKGVYVFYLKSYPPRTHNLVLLHERIEAKYKLNLNDEQNDLIEFLNEKSIPSRYPDVLAKVLEEFKKDETTTIVNNVKELIQCLKNQLKV